MQDSLSPGLMVVHGNRLEDLRDLMVAWMQREPLAPLEDEVILVQSNGMAQWLRLALAAPAGGGIAMALQVALPARFLWQLYRTVLGAEAIPRQSPLDKGPLTWRLMRQLPDLLAQPEFVPLRRFLADDGDLRKRHQLSERLADLFDQYQVYRADWLADWAAGRDRLRRARGGEQPLAPEQMWQPALWRAVLADLAGQEALQGRAQVHERAVRALASAPTAPPGLPRRVMVFGISSMPAQTLEALAALARFSQVLLCVHNPCQYHWADIVPDRDLLRSVQARQPRRKDMPESLDDDVWHQHAHPLLAAWGKQGRDYIHLLDLHDDPAHYRERFQALGERIDLFESGDVSRLLGQLQDDILQLRPLAETRQTWPPVAAADDSICFHVAHSPQREVEILHDRLLARLDADPTLQPRDVIVMVPDIDRYAPHVQAVFGQVSPQDPRWIPFTVADQGARGREPLLIALERLLQWPEGRQTVTEVLDLLDVPALRARFGLAEADLPLLHRWIEGAGIRWGLDAAQRQRRGQQAGLDPNTWRFGLRRMLLGYAVGRGDPWQEIVPYDEIGGLDAALLGPLDALLEALEALDAELSSPGTPEQWSLRLSRLLERFFLPQSDRDQGWLTQLLQGAEEWLSLCQEADLTLSLPLTVVREAWLAALDTGAPLGQRFLAGAVNVCTLMPMRAIPFRVVCLLGMNDGDYPRAGTPLDFDLMADDYRPGDRSRREDDRYLMLEALLAAREQLYVSWVGRSLRDNSEQPPSVLVGQLRDHLQQGWQCQGGGDLLAALTTEHPLQPFHQDYFRAGPLQSYAREWAAVHRPPADEDRATLPPLPLQEPLSLEGLQRWLRQPVQTFFAERLRVHLDDGGSETLDDEPFTLDGLERHRLKAELLQDVMQVLRQADLRQAALRQADLRAMSAEPLTELVQDTLQASAARLQHSGRLPMAGFGAQWRQELAAALPGPLRRWLALRARWSRPAPPWPVQVQQDQVELAGWISDLWQDPDGHPARLVLEVGTLFEDSRRGPRWKWRRLLPHWVLQVVACAEGLPLTTLLVEENAVLALPPLAPAMAQEQLALWLTALPQMMQTPVPVELDTALTWLMAREEQDEREARDQARRVYEGQGERAGRVTASATLARQFPHFDALWDAGLADWSERLYAGMIAHPPQIRPGEERA